MRSQYQQWYVKIPLQNIFLTTGGIIDVEVDSALTDLSKSCENDIRSDIGRDPSTKAETAEIRCTLSTRTYSITGFTTQVV